MSTDNVTPITARAIAAPMSRRNVVGAYVLARLRRECFDASGELIRGKQAEIVRATTFTSAHVTLVFKRAKEGPPHGRAPGRAFAEALAQKVWHISPSELDAMADAWSAEHPAQPPRSEEPPWWRIDPAWSRALDEAKQEAARRGLKIPAGSPGQTDYFALAGDAVVPGRAPTPEGIIRLAELLWVTDGRP